MAGTSPDTDATGIAPVTGRKSSSPLLYPVQVSPGTWGKLIYSAVPARSCNFTTRAKSPCLRAGLRILSFR